MKVIIVDDDKLVCMSLRTILEMDEEIEIAAVGYSGGEAVRLYEQHRPDLLLMDIRMQDMTGIDAAEQILSSYPDARILFLTTFFDDDYIVKALKIGAKGYLLKQKFERIVPAIKAVELGQSVFGDEIVTKLPQLMASSSRPDYRERGVTEREQEVIELVAQGLSNREIAEKLFLSEGTVRNYISTVLDKLELRDRTQLAVFYYNHRG
ncbi:response regulator [Candidatus Soleaferrea massiliensis]|uniref:response regulator n=1 Tax=Candidatus Soleaferrea massiliensis TaxID=1470354 RepID=UPI00058DC61A|nr:response regulator transcription factor [Candidatus Soleaferrea massiliensis]